MLDQSSIKKLVEHITIFQEKSKIKGFTLYTPEQIVEYLSTLDDEALQKTLQLAAMIAIGGNFKKPNV